MESTLKAKMNLFFQKISPEELKEKFEALGCVFEYNHITDLHGRSFFHAETGGIYQVPELEKMCSENKHSMENKKLTLSETLPAGQFPLGQFEGVNAALDEYYGEKVNLRPVYTKPQVPEDVSKLMTEEQLKAAQAKYKEYKRKWPHMKDARIVGKVVAYFKVKLT